MDHTEITLSTYNNYYDQQNYSIDGLSHKINELKNLINCEIYDEKLQRFIKQIPDMQYKSLIIETNSDLEKSLLHLKTYINFRLAYENNWIVNRMSVIDLIKSKTAFWYKHDKSNIPCLILRVKNFIPANHLLSDIFRFLIYMVDDIFHKIQKTNKHNNNKLKKFCVIYDREDFDKEKNFSQEFVEVGKSYREANVANFSDMIHKVYICNVGLIFRMMFSVAKIFIPKKYVDKILLLGDIEDLLEYFDRECLLKEYGGEFEYDGNQDDF